MWHYMSTHPEVFPETTEEGIEWVKKKNYAFLLESATNEYNVQRHCELMQVGQYFLNRFRVFLSIQNNVLCL